MLHKKVERLADLVFARAMRTQDNRQWHKLLEQHRNLYDALLMPKLPANPELANALRQEWFRTRRAKL